MAFDEELADRIRSLVRGRSDIAERKMFGGLAFLLRGHMCFGIVETDLMVRHLHALRSGSAIEAPLYDFARYVRHAATEPVAARRAIIVEGILIYTDAALRALMDVKVFVDTDDDTRFIRRLQRDITERGRTVQSVIDQYLATVKPMHLEFVEPSKRYADIIVPQGGHNAVAIDMLLTLIRGLTSG